MLSYLLIAMDMQARRQGKSIQQAAIIRSVAYPTGLPYVNFLLCTALKNGSMG